MRIRIRIRRDRGSRAGRRIAAASPTRIRVTKAQPAISRSTLVLEADAEPTRIWIRIGARPQRR
jgi:hypothetical protein